MKKSNFSSIESIIKTVKKNGMYILVDDESKHEEMENEGDLVISTSAVNPNHINFMAKHARGLICLAMDNAQSKKIGLTLASPINQSRSKTAFTYSIEAKKGVTTGISAYDRARTIKAASNKNAKKNDIVSPGHVFPVIARDGGVLVRAGHTEASVDISKLAKKHKLKIGKIEDLIAYRLKREKLIKLKKTSSIIVQKQKFKIKVFENLLDGSENFALIKGILKKGVVPRLRVISSNVVQNYLINQKLPNSFDKTISYFKKYNNCVLVFIRDPNLKSVTQTLKQYKSKTFYKKGHDKLIRNYGIGAQIIKSLNIKNMILVTRSKKKVIGLEGYGIKIKKTLFNNCSKAKI